MSRRATPSVKLERREITRRLWHFGPGLIALALTQVPGLDEISPTAIWCVLAGSVLAAGAALWHHRSIARAHEKNGVPAVLGYVGPVLLMMCAFPQYPELALTLLGIMAFGDGSATLFGMLYGSRRLPWNPRKTWIGTMAFLLVGIPFGMWIYHLAAVPHVSTAVAIMCAGTGAVCAGLIESLPLPGNDNLRTSAAAAAGLLLMHAFVVGFS